MEQQRNVSCTDISEDLATMEAAAVTTTAASPNRNTEIPENPDSNKVSLTQNFMTFLK